MEDIPLIALAFIKMYNNLKLLQNYIPSMDLAYSVNSFAIFSVEIFLWPFYLFLACGFFCLQSSFCTIFIVAWTLFSIFRFKSFVKAILPFSPPLILLHSVFLFVQLAKRENEECKEVVKASTLESEALLKRLGSVSVALVKWSKKKFPNGHRKICLF